MRFLPLILLFAVSPAIAQIEIQDAWSRATPPGARVAAGYLVIRNKAASADRLVSATSPASERVETHVQIKDGDVMRMREVKGYDIPAKGSFELKPGGAHLMFVNIKAPFRYGDRIPLVLKFERAGAVRTELHAGNQPAPHRH